MSDAIIVAIISGLFSLVGIVISYKSATEKVQHQMDIQQAVMQTEMTTMKADIKEHNHYAKLFAESMPVVQEQIKVINHRIDDLEKHNERKGA